MKYVWTPLFGKFQSGRGHRFFEAPDGRIAVADESGEFPEDTDDGVLYLDFKRPVVGTSMVFLPVVDEEGEMYTVPTGRIPTQQLIEKLSPRLRFAFDEDDQVNFC